MSLRRRVAALAGSAALALGTAALLPSPALAAPTGCTAWVSGNMAYSQCTGGTGQHSVAVQQWHPYAGPILVTGPWQPPGTISSTQITPWPVQRVWTNKLG
ncbi:hypothetical protein [Nonomuraea sp. NPDC050310]|uniref:hypothetical protein n=1 Tax=unclassified Nonomuraea TaxID=2593643 RepID=UPI0033E4A645